MKIKCGYCKFHCNSSEPTCDFCRTTDYEVIQICDSCYCTFPCQHDCIYNGEVVCLSAYKIYDILEENKIEIPQHFKYMKDVVAERNLLKQIGDIRWEELHSHYLYDKLKDRIFSKVVDYNRGDLAEKILNNGYILTRDIFLTCVKTGNLNLFKFLYNNLVDKDILHKNGMHYIAHGGNTLISMAAYHKHYELLKYMIEDIKIPYPKRNPLFEIMDITDECKVCKFLINKMVELDIKVENADDIARLKKLGLYDKFVSLGIANDIKYDLKYRFRYGVEEITDKSPENFKDKEIKKPEDLIELILVRNMFKVDLNKICYQNLRGLKKMNINLPRFFVGLKNMKIDFVFEGKCKIQSCNFMSSGYSIYELKNTDDSVSFNFIDPVTLHGAVFTMFELEFNIDTVNEEDVYIKNITYDILFEGKEDGQFDGKNYRLDDKIVVRKTSGTIGKILI